MPQIKNISTGTVYAVAKTPQWANGIWECGDARFADQLGNEYEAINALTLLSPMAFYLAFTPAERMSIKASADATVKEFWATFELAVQLGHEIDPNLVSVSGGVDYLISQGLVATARKADILAGVAQ